jgi:methyl-accepting chemotaxis protein
MMRWLRDSLRHRTDGRGRGVKSRGGITGHALERLVANVVTHIGQLGYETGYVLGNLHQLSDEATSQAIIFEKLSAATEQIKAQNHAVVDAAQAVLEHAVQIRDRSAECQDKFEDSAPVLRDVSDWLTGLSERIDMITNQLKQVGDAAAQIGRIATQTHVLALNASIEAAKSVSDGRGFAVIAASVRALASESASSAASIDTTLAALATSLEVFRADSGSADLHARSVRVSTDAMSGLLADLRLSATRVSTSAEAIEEMATASEDGTTHFVDSLSRLTDGMDRSQVEIARSRDRVASLLVSANAVLQNLSASGVRTADTPYIEAALDAADRARTIFESAIAEGAITRDELFDENYIPIPGTDPPQVLTRFTEFAERRVLPLMESVHAGLPQSVYCVAGDRNGYAPANTAEYSHPQGPDAAWNDAHCRNRRIFDNEVAIRAAKNRTGPLIQVYRRDLGGGTFDIVKDAAAPIFVNTEHWGAFRIGYVTGSPDTAGPDVP